MSHQEFVNCTNCGKRLIEKTQKGLWYFRFGKSEGMTASPVEIFISGSIKIKCLRKSCGHWNTFDCFPEV